MRLVDLQRLSDRQKAGPADERGVVVPQDVGPALGNDRTDAGGMDDRAPELLGKQVRQETVPGPEPDPPHAVGRSFGLNLAAKDQVAVLVVDDGHIMPARRQRARHPLHADRIAAEGVGRIERREHDDTEWRHAAPPTWFIVTPRPDPAPARGLRLSP